MKWALAPLGAALVALSSCRALPEIESNLCGNGVLEKGEACDTFPLVPGLECRPAGVVGECQHDCTLRSDGSRPGCPDGYGCGADGVCRQETPDFEPASVPLLATSISWLSKADFDGDGQLEVLSAEPADALQHARFRLHYFGRDGSLLETRTFPRLTTRPIARDVNGDERDDLIFSNTNLRIGMLPGREDREWVPAAFSSYVVPGEGLFVLGVAEETVAVVTPLVAVAALVGTSGELETGLFVPDLASRKLQPRAFLPRRFGELVGPPAAGDLFTGLDSPCSEVILAFRGDDRIYVYDMCASSPDPASADLVWRDEAIVSTASLPPGATVEAAPLVADVDGDGHLDVLVGSAEGALWVKGDGQSLAAVAEELRLLLESPSEDPPFMERARLPMPLAAGDLSGDGVADYVLPGGVLSSYTRRALPGVRHIATVANRGTPWSMATIEDLNGNGFLDVVAATEGQPGLTFLNGTGAAAQVASSLPTRGAVRHLTAGDFDADLIGDVAFIEEDAAGGHFLALAFGAPNATPAFSRQVAELTPVDQLSSAAESGFDHLLVSSRQRRDGAQLAGLTLFDGDSDGLPFAPYTLVQFAEGLEVINSLAVALAVGRFSQSGAADVLTIGSRQDLSGWDVWLVPSIGQHEPPRLLKGPEKNELIPISQQESAISLHAAGAAADLDGDGVDEAIWVVPDERGTCFLLIQEIDAAHGTFAYRDVIELDEACPSPVLAAVDLDGEHRPDLVLLLGDPERAPRRVRVLWNDERGSFSLQSSARIAAPDGSDITAFHAFPALRRDEPGRRIAFVSETGLWVAEPRAAQQHPSYVVGAVVQKLDRGRAVVVTDANADGVPDILAGDAAGLWLLRAKLR